MLYHDLIEYYKKEHNECNEIILVSLSTGDKHIFRRYQKIFTNTYVWADTGNGYIYDSMDLLKYYDLPVTNIYEKYKALKEGAILQVKTKQSDKKYYKKIDSDVFIECDIGGHIKHTCMYSIVELKEKFETIKIFM